jgi:hypothetical protein
LDLPATTSAIPSVSDHLLELADSIQTSFPTADERGTRRARRSATTLAERTGGPRDDEGSGFPR